MKYNNCDNETIANEMLEKRDHFASCALIGLMSNQEFCRLTPKQLAERAFDIADEMMNQPIPEDYLMEDRDEA